MNVRFVIDGSLTAAQWREVGSSTAKLSVRLAISYHDSFGAKPEPVGWCAEYIPGEQQKWNPCVF